jgi:hypothetical protein
MEARRPDDPMARPAYVRPAPVRRHLAIRLVVTVAAALLFYDMYLWFGAHDGPPAAIGVVLAGPLSVLALLTLVWAWRKHQF